MTDDTAPQHGASIRAHDPARDGYHESWYPVAMSREIGTGQVISKAFLDGRVVVWRGEDGAAHVHSAFCRHLGADLALGTVEGNVLRCVFHAWDYDGSGRCVRVPVADRAPPANAQLFDFPTAEKWGLIWAFNGTEPLFDVPVFPTVDEGELAHRVFEIEPLPVPPYVILANTHDFQHVAVVHGATMASEPTEFDNRTYTVEFKNQVHDAVLGPSDQHFMLYGLNTLALSNRFARGEILSLFSATPIGGGMTKGYTVTASRRQDDGSHERVLDIGEGFAREIMEDDNAVLKTIRFKPDILIMEDRALARWLKRAADYPSAHPSQPFIT